MYRDLVGEVVKFIANGKKWYYQQFCGIDGMLKHVNLYDEVGNFVVEFDSMEELKEFVEGVKE